MKLIRIWLKETSQVIEHRFINTYQKGDMFCICTSDETGKFVYKYPIQNIFRVVEDYWMSNLDLFIGVALRLLLLVAGYSFYRALRYDYEDENREQRQKM